MTEFFAFSLGIILDIVIVAILVTNIVLGAKRGFVKTVYRFIRLAAAFGAAYFLAKPLAAMLKGTAIYKNLIEGLEKSLGGYLAEHMTTELPELLSQSSGEFAALLERLGRTPDEVSSEYSRLAAQQSADAVDGAINYIVTPACDAILTVLSFITVFFVTLLLLYLAMKLLNLIASAPVLGGLNRFMGVLAGILIAFIQILIFTMLFDAALPYLEGLGIGLSAAGAAKSVLYSLFSSINPIALIIALTA